MGADGEELAKDLGPLAALTIGVGTMIGAGIFVLPGAAIERAGWFAVLSFVLGGGIALLTALSASELGTAMPKSGGAYYYVNQALGPLFGSIAGWSNWLGLAFASAFYMVGFGEYVRAIFGLGGPLVFGPVAVSPVKVAALGAAAFFVFVNYVGAKETGRLQNVIVVVLIVILAVFTVVGALRADPANLPAPTGLSPMLTTTGLIFVSYLGFVQITSVAEEIKQPGKNLPRAVIGSVLIVTAIYALVLITMAAAVEQGFIAEQQLAGNIAVVEVGRLLLGPVGALALLVGGLLATASSANASILASSRINFAMGRDRIVTPDLNDVHDRFGTPYRSIAITGGFILAFIVVGGFLVVGYLALSGGSGSDGPYGSIHEHGTFEMVVDGEAVDFNDPQYIENDPHFHFHGGDQVENSDRYVSHVHANGVTIQYALRTLGMSVNEAGTELSYDGTTYDASNEGTTINITVDGDPVDPGDYELGGVDIPPARQGEGDDVKIVVNSSG